MLSEYEQNTDHRPVEGMAWVNFVALIRHNATGEVRGHVTFGLMDPAERTPQTFIWEGGNYSCDCARAQFFAEAVGEPDPDIACGDGMFSVQLKNPKTGDVFYDEFDE